MTDRTAIGVDVGGTKIALASVDAEGKMHFVKKYPTQAERGSAFVIDALIASLEDNIQQSGSQPSAIGIGIPGQVEEKSGTVLLAPNLDWHQVPFKAILEQHFQIPIFITNDVRAATWGEWRHGAGKGQQDIVCLFIGTGIGGGIISGGKMLTGANNSAGEWGHTRVSLDGPLCSCGSKGCLESFAGGWALARQARENPSLLLLKLCGQDVTKMDAHHIIDAANQGDPFSIHLVERALEALTASCISIVNALNPSLLILGGGLGEALPHLIEKVKEGIASSALPAARAACRVVPAQLKNDAGIIGAASLAREEYL